MDGKEYKVLEATFVKKEGKNPGIIEEVSKETLGITCQDGIIYVKKIKPFGKKAMDIKDYLNGMNSKSLINQDIK